MLNQIFRLILPGLLIASNAMASPQDPLQSVMWDFMLKNELKLDPGQVIFDDRIEIYAPASVEDGMNVPVSVKVNGLEQVEEIIVLADHNPIQRALNFYPGAADPYIAFRMKVQEATPIRAVVRTVNGKWYAGGVWLNAPGGGCTTASVSQQSQLWESSLNRIGAQVWNKSDGGDRLRMRIIHPMDTGLVSSIPAFFIESLSLRDNEGNHIARLETFEAVSENPVFTFSVPADATNGVGYQLVGNDNNGNVFAARVNIPESPLNLESLFAVND
ncbi:MAG: quinoprotein dehydrogenase-associated SoxYZ-like carrier [Gammaproteobacteria bacterium]|nr:quinoprotein dehydrogenase-associated SoxYZ-like carrier [Gammaproteobacteria bacterium]